MKHDFLDKYCDLNSPIHRLDPRTKLIAFFLAILIIVSEPKGALAPFACYFLLLGMLIWISRIPLKHVIKRSLIASPFILASTGLLPFSVYLGGEIAQSTTPEYMWQQAGSILLKAYAAIILLTILTATEKFHRLLSGLRQLKMPILIGAMLALMYRYIFILIDELHKTTRARLSRTPGVLKRNRFNIYGNQAAMIFVRSWERAQRIYSSMLSRGFTGMMPLQKELVFHRNDLFFFCFFTGSLCLIRFAA